MNKNNKSRERTNRRRTISNRTSSSNNIQVFIKERIIERDYKRIYLIELLNHYQSFH